MGEHPLRSILSRVIRGSGRAEEVELSYLHRGAPGDQLKVKVSTITSLGKGWFMLADGETRIPYHRVLYVLDLGSGQLLWEKRPPALSAKQRRLP